MNLFNIEIRDINYKKFFAELKNIPDWLKLALYTSIILGVMYFLFFCKPFSRSHLSESQVIELRQNVGVVHKKVNTLVNNDDYEYDKKQLLILLSILNTINTHNKLQENIEIELLMQHFKKYHIDDKNIINQFLELKNNNTVFFDTYTEEINQLMNKYYQKSTIDSITSCH